MSQDKKERPQNNDQSQGGLGPAKHTDLPDISAAQNKAAEALGNVNIVYGAHDIDLPIAGHTVKDVLAAVGGQGGLLNVDPKAEAYVNGAQVDSTYKLKAGDQLQFMKESGQKG